MNTAKITPKLSTLPVGSKVKILDVESRVKNPQATHMLELFGFFPNTAAEIYAKRSGVVVLIGEEYATPVGIRDDLADKLDISTIYVADRNKSAFSILTTSTKTFLKFVKSKFHK